MYVVASVQSVEAVPPAPPMPLPPMPLPPTPPTPDPHPGSDRASGRTGAAIRVARPVAGGAAATEESCAEQQSSDTRVRNQALHGHHLTRSSRSLDARSRVPGRFVPSQLMLSTACARQTLKHESDHECFHNEIDGLRASQAPLGPTPVEQRWFKLSNVSAYEAFSAQGWDRLRNVAEEVRDQAPTIQTTPAFTRAGGRDGCSSSGMERSRPSRSPTRAWCRIGRAENADIRIDHPSVSRRHALLHLGPPLRIEDLGSSNGTRVRDARLGVGRGDRDPARRRDRPRLDDAHRAARLGARARPRRLWTHGYFEGAARGRVRARRAQRRALRGRADPRRGQLSGAAPCEEALDGELGPMDVVAAYGPDEYEVLLLDSATGARRARSRPRVAGRIRRARRAQSRRHRVLSARRPRAGGAGRARLRGGARQRSRRRRSSPIVVHDGAMQRLHRLVERIAPGTISVLILGETGVGKEVLRRDIHRRSPRASKPFLRLNCAALSETLLESELFGHERGAFTGAVQTKPGLLETAEGGTVFLDEIGELPPGDPGQAPARARGARGAARRRRQAAADRRALRRRHQPRPRGRGRARRLPPGSVLPAERRLADRSRRCASASPRSTAGQGVRRRGYAQAGAASRCRRTRRATPLGAAQALQLAGQHPRAPQRDRARGAALRRRADQRASTCPSTRWAPRCSRQRSLEQRRDGAGSCARSSPLSLRPPRRRPAAHAPARRARRRSRAIDPDRARCRSAKRSRHSSASASSMRCSSAAATRAERRSCSACRGVRSSPGSRSTAFHVRVVRARKILNRSAAPDRPPPIGPTPIGPTPVSPFVTCVGFRDSYLERVWRYASLTTLAMDAILGTVGILRLVRVNAV